MQNHICKCGSNAGNQCRHILQEAIRNNTFDQKVVRYLIKKPKLLGFRKTFLFNKLEKVNKIFQREVDSKGRCIQLFKLINLAASHNFNTKCALEGNRSILGYHCKPICNWCAEHQKFKGHSKLQEEINFQKFSKPNFKSESVNPPPVYNCYGPFLADGLYTKEYCYAAEENDKDNDTLETNKNYDDDPETNKDDNLNSNKNDDGLEIIKTNVKIGKDPTSEMDHFKLFNRMLALEE
eukprot:3691626-Ditylum_brightwellii.AAC.1